ncbi:MAG TPA: SpoIIE family protein phosphatase [Streptosporangiaceae bacterium]|nr:SpoIIE family protein phosphatase [Streptosporangiaceae bacterium]
MAAPRSAVVAAHRVRFDRVAANASGLFALVLVGYAAGAELSWQSFSSGAAFGFPPAGITLAALLLTAKRRWPVIIASIVLGELAVDLQHHVPALVALGSSAANAVEPLVGATCVLYLCRGLPDLGMRAELLRFLLGAVVIGPLIGGLIGASVIVASAGGWWAGLVLQWWAGDGIAVLVVGAPILLWARRRPLVASRWREMALLVAVTAGLAVVAFRFSQPSAILFLPVLAWAAFWVGDLAVVLAGTAFAVVANYLTAAGYGEFAHLGLSSPASLAIAQLYIAVVVLICWLLAQEVSGRIGAIGERESARLQGDIADARRMAAELGDSLADTATVGQVAERVTGAVRTRLGGCRVVVDVPADLPERESANGAGSVEASVATLPLLGVSGALGNLDVQWPATHEISAAELEYLQAVAETTSRAVERARLRDAERIERERMETLSALTRHLAAALTPEAIGTVVSDRVRHAVGGADGLSLGVVNADRARLEWISIVGYSEPVLAQIVDLPLSETTAATDAARTGQPVIIRTAAEYAERYPGPRAAAVDAEEASWLVWPLTVGKATVGAIVLMWKRPQQFQPGQLAFIAAVADLVAHALVRARIYADEHAIATVLQRAVMPKMTAPIPGLEIGSWYRQAGTSWVIGGDWYDALALPAGRTYITVGDVAGHGISAAEDMTQIRNAGRALAIAGFQPSRLLAELRRLTASATKGQFATMTVAMLEADASRVAYASAGHPPLLIRRAKTGEVEVLPSAGGPPLGPFDDATYTQLRTRFHPGDIALLYTDGLVESRGDDIQLGIERIAAHLRAWEAGRPLDELCAQLVASVADQPQLDDICVLAVSRRAVAI